MTPVIALKAAIRTCLSADLALVAQLGGAKVFDDVPRAAQTPYVTFGDVVCRENGTATDRGHRSEINLIVWSRHGGTQEALAIGDVIAAALDDVTLPLAGHRMVACRIPVAETRRMPDKDLTRLTLRLVIITEVL